MKSLRRAALGLVFVGLISFNVQGNDVRFVSIRSNGIPGRFEFRALLNEAGDRLIGISFLKNDQRVGRWSLQRISGGVDVLRHVVQGIEKIAVRARGINLTAAGGGIDLALMREWGFTGDEYRNLRINAKYDSETNTWYATAPNGKRFNRTYLKKRSTFGILRGIEQVGLILGREVVYNRRTSRLPRASWAQ